MNLTVIEPHESSVQHWREAWRYRELLYFLVWRNLLVRYKQTIVGGAWAILRPLITMSILSVVFSRIGKLPSGGTPYVVLVLCGMLPWQLFSAGLADGGMSLVSNSNLVSKVYFPRLLIPVTSVLTNVVDFAISFAILVVMMIWFGVVPSLHILLLPLFVVQAFLLALGAVLWASALTVEYRDLRVVVPFVVQFGLYISPVGFFSAVVPESMRMLFSMNPMVGVIDGFRWSVLGGEHVLYPPAILASILVTIVLLLSGFWYFRRAEARFADVI